MGRISNYGNGLKKDYDAVVVKNEKLEKDNKMLKLKLDIAESKNQRKDKIIAKHDEEMDEKDKVIEALKNKIIAMTKELDLTTYERDQYLSKLNIVVLTQSFQRVKLQLIRKK